MLERGQSCYPLYLENYNNGTGAAKNDMRCVISFAFDNNNDDRVLRL
jgi:hypothetical protein